MSKVEHAGSARYRLFRLIMNENLSKSNIWRLGYIIIVFTRIHHIPGHTIYTKIQEQHLGVSIIFCVDNMMLQLVSA